MSDPVAELYTRYSRDPVLNEALRKQNNPASQTEGSQATENTTTNTDETPASVE